MDGLDHWDYALLAVATLGAVWKLVALMRARRDRLVADVQQQVDQHRQAQNRAEKQQREAA